jgi:GntR family transcriptional regulator
MSPALVRPVALQSRNKKSIGEQAREAVVALIAREGLRAGDKLPSEAELCRLFSISRPTLREALSLLEQDGQIITMHGRGRFLSAAAALRVERPITAYESVTSLLHELGYKAQTRLLSVDEHPADKEIAKALRCRVDSPVVTIERVRAQSDAPLIYSLATILRRNLPETLDESALAGSLNELLALGDRQPRMSTASVSAVELPKRVLRAIGTNYEGPWLLVAETCFTEQGDPVLFALDYHRGDAFSFNFTRR